jgi:hypothetical protein
LLRRYSPRSLAICQWHSHLGCPRHYSGWPYTGCRLEWMSASKCCHFCNWGGGPSLCTCQHAGSLLLERPLLHWWCPTGGVTRVQEDVVVLTALLCPWFPLMGLNRACWHSSVLSSSSPVKPPGPLARDTSSFFEGLQAINTALDYVVKRAFEWWALIWLNKWIY